MKSNLQVFFYSILSGILLSLAIPNELYLMGCPIFSFIAILPYYRAIKNCRSFSQAVKCGFLQTLTTHLISSFWLAFFKDYAIFTLGGSALWTIIIGCTSSILMYFPFSKKTLTKNIFSNRNVSILLFTCAYVIYEFIKSTGFIGYPWGTISSTMYKFPILMQIASITGPFGITFIVVFFNCILEELLVDLSIPFSNIKQFIKSILKSQLLPSINFFIIIFLSSLIYGLVQYYMPRTPQKSVTTILVQQNQNPWDTPDDNKIISESEELTLREVNKLKELNKKPELVVWSEGSIQRSFPGNYPRYKSIPESYPLISFIQDVNAPFVLGGSTSKKIYLSDKNYRTDYYNSALVFNSDGTLAGSYEKLHLVPFAELIPGIDNPIVYSILQNVVGISAGWAKGLYLSYFDIPCTSVTDEYIQEVHKKDNDNPNIQNFIVDEEKEQPRIRISTPICYDDAFADTMRPLYNNGSQLFVNITDDSWSLKHSSEYQHFIISAYRAIEFRTTFVRSTNAGVTVVLDPCAKVLASLPLFTSDALTYDIPVYKRRLTTFALLGNWLGWLCVIIISFASILKIKISQE